MDSSAEDVSRDVQQVPVRHLEPEHDMDWEALREWMLRGSECCGIGDEVLEEGKSPEEAGMPYAGVEELKEQYRERTKRAYMEGLAEGLATMVYRQARLRFDAETAERLSQLMKGIADPERISRIAEHIIECETGPELLARARDD